MNVALVDGPEALASVLVTAAKGWLVKIRGTQPGHGAPKSSSRNEVISRVEWDRRRKAPFAGDHLPRQVFPAIHVATQHVRLSDGRF